MPKHEGLLQQKECCLHNFLFSVGLFADNFSGRNEGIRLPQIELPESPENRSEKSLCPNPDFRYFNR